MARFQVRGRQAAGLGRFLLFRQADAALSNRLPNSRRNAGLSHPLDVLFDLAVETDMNALFLQYLTRASDEEAVQGDASSQLDHDLSRIRARMSARLPMARSRRTCWPISAARSSCSTLPEAVEMMTSRSAQGTGALPDRGRARRVGYGGGRERVRFRPRSARKCPWWCMTFRPVRGGLSQRARRLQGD